jgi:hypothetical protein
MHPEPHRPGTVREQIEHDISEIRRLLSDPTIAALVLERLPSGELAWLRPDPDQPIPYCLTERGRTALADEELAM